MDFASEQLLKEEEKSLLGGEEKKESVFLLKKYIMLKKKNRLSSNILFKRVFEEGARKENKGFLIFFRKNNLSSPRFGIIVSTKVSKLAVERNKLKRKIRAGLIDLIPVFREGWDIIIISKKYSLRSSFSKIKEMLGDLLIRLS